MKTQRFFYDKTSGEVFFELNTSNDNLIEDEILRFKPLSERNRATFDLVEVPFGKYAQDFAECSGYKVNTATKTLEFSYPDPNNPTAPQVFETPLTDQIKLLKNQQSQLSADFQGLTDYLAETGVL